MKTNAKLILSAVFVLFFSTLATAQVGRIMETTVEYDKTTVDALAVTLQPERKDVQEAFEDWMDDRYDINLKRGGLFANKRTQKAEDAIIPAISADRITFMTKTEEVGDETRLYVFAMRGNNPVDRADYKAFTGMENIFDSFLSSYQPEYYEERVAEAREELEDLREDLKDAQDDIADNKEKIAKLQKENTELEDKSAKLREEIKTAEVAVRTREEMRTEVKREMQNVGSNPRRNN